jgi:hypothetical protein
MVPGMFPQADWLTPLVVFALAFQAVVPQLRRASRSGAGV